MNDLYIRGMHGMGDNIHQRAVIRAFIKRGFDITLETSWPCIYHDLPVNFVRRPVALRTQLKNAERESLAFIAARPPHHTGRTVGVSYNRNTVMGLPSKTILEGMFTACGIGEDYPDADYRLPIRDEWKDEAWRILRDPAKPIMIYRPLCARPEYRGSAIRNADPGSYAELVAMVRDSFYVVSVADLEQNREWIVGPQLIPDLTLHHGELTFDTLAAVTARASLMFTSSGFAAILGPAVGTPTISISGGYEPAVRHSDGAKWVPYLGIDTTSPCTCATSTCSRPCPKTIDMPHARAAIAGFLDKLGYPAAGTRPIAEMFAPGLIPPPNAPHSAPRQWPRVTAPRPGHPSHLYQRRPPVRA